MRPWMLALALCCGACATRPLEPVSPPKPPPTRPEPEAAPLPEPARRAIEIVGRIYRDDLRGVYESFGDNFREAVPFEKVQGITRSILAENGRFIEARFLDGERDELHVVAFFERGTRLHVVSLDTEGVLRGLWVRPFVDKKSSAGPADGYMGKREYRPPFEGAWLVGRGGHVGNVHQWYAYDLVVRGADGNTYDGDGKDNEDYLAWGRPVLAPADGVIAIVVDGILDHGIDHTDKYFVPGNLVVIDHGEGEFSFLCHFQRGSIVVKPGDAVLAGTTLGKVGNSGNSSEPHIHWHLGTNADVSRGHGLPIRFGPLLVNGARTEAPRPGRGDIIEVP